MHPRPTAALLLVPGTPLLHLLQPQLPATCQDCSAPRALLNVTPALAEFLPRCVLSPGLPADHARFNSKPVHLARGTSRSLSQLQLQPACQGSPGAACPGDFPGLVPVSAPAPGPSKACSGNSFWPINSPAPAGLPQTPDRCSLQRGSYYTRPLFQDPERVLFCLIHRNKQRNSQNEQTEKHVPNEKSRQNPRKRTIANETNLFHKQFYTLVIRMVSDFRRID